MGNFDFIRDEWPELHAVVARAEGYAAADPGTSVIHARRAIESLLTWLYETDPSLRQAYRNDLAAMINEPSLRAIAGDTIRTKLDLIRRKGNDAAHKPAPIDRKTSFLILRELFHVYFWAARTYLPNGYELEATFDPDIVPRPERARAKTQAELRELADELAAKDAEIQAEREKALAEREDLERELAQMRANLATARTENETRLKARPETHDFDEAATRDAYIDQLLVEAGWDPDAPNVREHPIAGAGADGGMGYADYVLWASDGAPLAVIEAKRTRRDPRDGLVQARLYADALERSHGRRPVIFTTNGYEHWIHDDAGYADGSRYAERRVAGFYTEPELGWLHQRRAGRRPLHGAPLPASATAIVGRDYQQQAIRAVAEEFDARRGRGALLVMATGTGKTRTAIALVDTLMKAGWVKRVLFLADREALVRQAASAFQTHLPSAPIVNLLQDKQADARVFVSTYPTMLNLINRGIADGSHRFGPGYFDLVIIDEAHRSVYQKYGEIFRHFDALLVGLTATPKDEVDHNTYDLFGLEDGVPTSAYPLDQAIAEGHLVPPAIVDVPLRFVRTGVRYDDLTEDEKDEWDALDWGEDVDPPDAVDAEALNRWLFNTDTVDRALGYLMERGRRVEGGDRIGKTIVFAKNQRHARYIVERFNAQNPALADTARVVVSSDDRAQTTLEDFADPSKRPDIAVSVDMLDTGVDVPEVVNLVFFKRVFTSSKFWQMIGRGTRLRPDLYGPGEHKRDFVVIDLLGNAEWFNSHLQRETGHPTRSLRARTFETRFELTRSIDALPSISDDLARLRGDVAARLLAIVTGMRLDNVLVRPQRRWVERFGSADAWEAERLRALGGQEIADATDALADLPTMDTADGTDEDAKRFDLMMITLQVGALRPEVPTDIIRQAVQGIAANLLESTSVPAIAAQVEWLDRLAGDEWWADVTAPMLEVARIRVRGLVHLIKRGSRDILYTDFQDEIGDARAIELTATARGVNYERFRAKARDYFRSNLEHLALQRLRRNVPITSQDLDELGQILVDAGVGSAEDVRTAGARAKGLGHFIRSLVGVEKSAVEEAFRDFLQREGATRAQQDFVRMVIDFLTTQGELDPNLLFDPPFTDDDPEGVSGVFPDPLPLIARVRTFTANAEVPA
ncbi:DEAD/DEAH box helicase family protein [Microbacterium sp. NPDC055683]